jgi:hypothetical protein
MSAVRCTRRAAVAGPVRGTASSQGCEPACHAVAGTRKLCGRRPWRGHGQPPRRAVQQRRLHAEWFVEPLCDMRTYVRTFAPHDSPPAKVWEFLARRHAVQERRRVRSLLRRAAENTTRCNIPRHVATSHDTLQHPSTRCNIPRHVATSHKTESTRSPSSCATAILQRRGATAVLSRRRWPHGEKRTRNCRRGGRAH